jgi:hypothetical protein
MGKARIGYLGIRILMLTIHKRIDRTLEGRNDKRTD